MFYQWCMLLFEINKTLAKVKILVFKQFSIYLTIKSKIVFMTLYELCDIIIVLVNNTSSSFTDINWSGE